MAIVQLLTGTTADYKEVENVLILDEREIAVEITTGSDGTKYFNMRQGDGKSTFFNLPIIVNNQRYEELNVVMSQYYDKIKEFSTDMVSSASKANQAAESANTAAKKAESAAENISQLTSGLNSMTDTINGNVYTLGVENGVLFIEDNN